MVPHLDDQECGYGGCSCASCVLLVDQKRKMGWPEDYIYREVWSTEAAASDCLPVCSMMRAQQRPLIPSKPPTHQAESWLNLQKEHGKWKTSKRFGIPRLRGAEYSRAYDVTQDGHIVMQASSTALQYARSCGYTGHLPSYRVHRPTKLSHGRFRTRDTRNEKQQRTLEMLDSDHWSAVEPMVRRSMVEL